MTEKDQGHPNTYAESYVALGYAIDRIGENVSKAPNLWEERTTILTGGEELTGTKHADGRLNVTIYNGRDLLTLIELSNKEIRLFKIQGVRIRVASNPAVTVITQNIDGISGNNKLDAAEPISDWVGKMVDSNEYIDPCTFLFVDQAS